MSLLATFLYIYGYYIKECGKVNVICEKGYKA